MLLTAGRYWGNTLSLLKLVLFGVLLCAVPFPFGGCAPANTLNTAPANIPLLEKWSADYPVSDLERLPAGQQDTRAGYIGDTETFIPVWRVFMPEQILPAVDFRKNIVVFTRNIQFYNQTIILRVSLHGGIAEIVTLESMSAMPIEDRVAMAMAVIPRDEVMAIQAGTEKIQVMDYE